MMSNISRTWLPLTLALFLLSGPVRAAVERVDNFALLDEQGQFHELRHYGDSKAVVFISLASDCAANFDSLPKYQLLRTTWERQGIRFLGLASAAGEKPADIRQMSRAYSLDMPVLLDSSQLVAENLGISRAGELVVVHPERLKVLYRGGLDRDGQGTPSGEDGRVLVELLSDIAAGETPGLEQTLTQAVNGCALDFPARQKHLAKTPDYATEVAPILKDKCAGCHVEGGIAPFAMDSHRMVQGWSSMVKEVLLTRRMPPAQVDPQVKHFTNARYMAPAELQTLVHWVEAGAPGGDSEQDPLASIQASKSLWQLGEPDYIVEVPPFTVPATGVLDYVNVTVNLPFTEDVWVKSVQHIPGDRRALHHLLSFIVPADYDARIVEGENDQYRELLEGYAPGKEAASTYPEGAGVFIPQGSAVQMSIHYTTFGKEIVDRTRLGLYFAEQEPEHHYSTYSLSHGGDNLRIPPGVSEHKMSATHVFDDAITLHGLRPHMHYRGKYMRFSVVYPDGSRDEILNVPNYSFNWQPTYRLSNPMELPAGSRVIIEGAFDNSPYNLGNPDPRAEVRGGAQSWDEMFIGYFSYYKTAGH